MRRYGLSKSKIASFEQCPKRLWLQVHRPEEGMISTDTRRAFTIGHEVGELACAQCQDGILIEAKPDLAAAIRLTAELLELDPPRPLFEATFERDRVLVRVDLMIPAGGGRWHIAEVKSSTSAKPHFLSDLATQIWVLERCGIKIASASIRHIDNQFVYEEDGCYDGLFKDFDAVEAIAPLIISKSDVASAALQTLQDDEPVVEPGDQCSKPYECEFQDYCNRGRALPQWPITLLPNTGAKLAKEWAEKGVIELVELEETALRNEVHRRIHQVTSTGTPYHDCAAAIAATETWKRPFSYLDFETIAFAVPRWKGTRPYEQVPFQFSLDVEFPNGELVHREFLDLSGNDPRRACAEALVEGVPDTGAVIAYNASFERSRLKELAAVFPDLASALRSIAERVVDLLPVAKACWYHRDQRGSWSIKEVLPTLVPELSYDSLAVADGGAAQIAFAEAISPQTEPQRRDDIEMELRAYCGLDTLAMVAVHRRLVGLPLPSLEVRSPV